MRYVEDLRDKHKGEEIWVLGCGPSLDDFPDNFFKNKISIALNSAAIAFPYSIYWLASHPEIVIAIGTRNPKMLKRAICTYPFVGTIGRRPISKESLKLLNSHKNEIIRFRWHRIIGNKKKFLRLYRNTVNSIMAKKSCRLTCFSTIAHYAIEVAAILGSRKITLVGCEAAARGKKWHAENRGIRKFLEPLRGSQYFLPHRKYIAKLSRFRQGTQALTLAFKPHGVEIQRYFFSSGYRSIIE
ncbi:hypothetical protein ES703_93113 [subsurface metagenome]